MQSSIRNNLLPLVAVDDDGVVWTDSRGHLTRSVDVEGALSMALAAGDDTTVRAWNGVDEMMAGGGGW